jgi:hypothetical protein
VGRFDDAQTKIRTTLEATGKAHMPHWEALLLRERGRLAHTQEDSAAANDDFAAAIKILDELGSRIELGRTLVLRESLGLGSADDIERARSLLEASGATGDLSKISSS